MTTEPHRKTTSRCRYPSDPTDRQFARVKTSLPERTHRGRPVCYDLRDVLNAVSYRWTTGCSWRMLPHDFPPWQTVYSYFRDWNRAGQLPAIREALLHRGSGRFGRPSDRANPRQRRLPLASDPPRNDVWSECLPPVNPGPSRQPPELPHDTRPVS